MCDTAEECGCNGGNVVGKCSEQLGTVGIWSQVEIWN